MDNYSRLRPLQRFFKLLELDRKDITYIYVYAIFSGLITLSIPLGVQAIIGLVAGGALSASLVILVVIVTAGTALSGILKVMQLTVTETIQRRIFARSAFDFAYRIPRLKLDSVIRHYPPELVNRFFDTLTLQKGVPKILMDFSTAILQVVFGLILIAFYHPFFILFGITLVAILLLIFRITGPGGLATSLKESKYKYEVAYWLEEMARTMSTFKMSGGSIFSLNKTDGLVCNYLDSRKKHFRILLFQYGSIVAFKAIVTAGLLFLGSYLVIGNQINIGQFVAAEIVVLLIMTSVEKLILAMEAIYDVLTALEKLGNVTDLPIEDEKGVEFGDIDTKKGMHIKVDQLSYSFSDAKKPTLDNVCFEAQPGEKICIAGYSGSGRVTLMQLLSGLYSDYKGAISFNGYPLRNLNITSLRHHIGDYSAREDIFRGTILENITLEHPEVRIDQVVSIADNIGLSNYVQNLPEGFDTMLLPEGRNIPQNIRTRIILARCIIAQPRLLAVEGFFYGMEKSDREMICSYLTGKDKPWTMVAISDDPFFASRCDRIIILKAGKVVEEGPFDQVLKSEHFERVFLPYNGGPASRKEEMNTVEKP
ncbi:MAG: ATP-binding cassette domain-containing protein [Phaeodactylibacter sp.]|nr:ATP-binding cassette domain-containing protein [Phaeodactylibacter sp.]MCB9266867.1 ATP-binding cassette domain-containing protein [Lewinellaceae bacterium]MCB9290104.1 ATP-binding cassette domain-containing protein [Lewinellaceae bacterium]